MSEINITINNTAVTLKEKSRRVYNAIVNTANPGADTVVKAVQDAGGQSFVDSFANNGNPTDVFKVIALGTSGGKKTTTTGESTRAKIAKKMELALSAETWQNKSVRVVEGKAEDTADTESDEMEVI